MELIQPGSFSALVGRRVLDQSGRRMGRVYDVSARWERDGSIVFESLLVGRSALWQRLKGPTPDARGVPWEAVQDVREDAIVVRK